MMNIWRSLAAVLAACMLLACAVTAQAVEPLEDVTLELLVYGTTVNIWQDNHDSPVQRKIKELTGVTLDQREVTEEQLTVILASGDLPDMLRVDPGKYGKGLIEGNHLVAIDDMLGTLGQDMLLSIPDTLEYSRLNWSQGTEKTYFVPVNIGPDLMAKENSMGAILRWDYYKEIGAPKIATEQDLLAALEQMVDAHPQTEDGKNVYGVSLWTDWGTWHLGMPLYFFTGMEFKNESCAIDVQETELVSITDGDKHPYWRVVRFLFEANQLGILDPDAFTMGYADFEAKALSGQILYAPANWPFVTFNQQHAQDGQGFMSVPIENGFQWHGDQRPMGWNTKCFAITNDCGNVEAAMRLMNFLWSYDGCRIMYSGIEGENWNVADGVPTLTDETIAAYGRNDDEWKRTNINLDYNIIGLSPSATHPDGYPLSLFNSSQVYSLSLDPLMADYCEFYGVSYPAEVFVNRIKDGTDINKSTKNPYVSAAIYTRSDEIKRIEGDLQSLLAQYAAKCALAADEDSFNKLVEEARLEFEKAGAQKNFESVSAWYEQAKENAKQYVK